MTPTPIRKVAIEDCGCVKQVEIPLTQLHALIGPNDSGKTTILRALRTAAQFGTAGFEHAKEGGFAPFMPLLSPMSRDGAIAITIDKDGLEYRIQKDGDSLFEMVSQGGRPLLEDRQGRSWYGLSNLWSSPLAYQDPRRRLERLQKTLAPATLVRFDPDALREPAKLLPENEGIRLDDERGRGLAAVYDAILNRDRDAFEDIESQTVELFPALKSIGLSNLDDGRKAMKVWLKDGTPVFPNEMSEGLLYFLGFAALRYCGAALFLVEEPENGLHPARVHDVVEILRRVSAASQVVVATHSPLVINELRPEEVTVVTRDEQGTHATPIGTTPGFDERSRIYALGELWLSYANGRDEAPLLRGGARE